MSFCYGRDGTETRGILRGPRGPKKILCSLISSFSCFYFISVLVLCFSFLAAGCNENVDDLLFCASAVCNAAQKQKPVAKQPPSFLQKGLHSRV